MIRHESTVTSQASKGGPAFAMWLTGLPGSGKSTIAAIVVRELRRRGIVVAALESDTLRQILTPHAAYTTDERDRFYEALAQLGAWLVAQRISVIFDATAHLRKYRDQARRLIDRFIEVHVATPLECCRRRDPKGLYHRASEGGITQLPGIQTPYEPPIHAQITVSTETDPPDAVAVHVMDGLARLGYLGGAPSRVE